MADQLGFPSNSQPQSPLPDLWHPEFVFDDFITSDFLVDSTDDLIASAMSLSTSPVQMANADHFASTASTPMQNVKNVHDYAQLNGLGDNREDDDEEQEEEDDTVDSASTVAPSMLTARFRSMLEKPLALCNNKTALDAEFPEEWLTASTIQFNRLVRSGAIRPEEVEEVRKARRRSKNRGYSKTFRTKRSEARRQKVHDVDERTLMATMTTPAALPSDAHLDAELASLQAENSQLRATVAQLERNVSLVNGMLKSVMAQLASHGIEVENLPLEH